MNYIRLNNKETNNEHIFCSS
ncbi:hypothetical protein BCEN4_740112 [Burkholderia cenocepacia]|nr:hypothetical protein BCEN4_740112 [Burkholderia cenocepacia]